MKNLDTNEGDTPTKIGYKNYTNSYKQSGEDEVKHGPKGETEGSVEEHSVESTSIKVPRISYSSYKEFLATYNTKTFSSVRPSGSNKKTIEESEIDGNRPGGQIKHQTLIQKTNTKLNKANGLFEPKTENDQNKNANLPLSPPFPKFSEQQNPITFTKNNEASYENVDCNSAERTKQINLKVNLNHNKSSSNEAPKIDKNDPEVKKLVYNYYRGMLGSYNNKANHMVSTLPKNMVRVDKGVTEQLEKITLNGGLDKINGRVNPNLMEQD